jgi:hypothetical protein
MEDWGERLQKNKKQSPETTNLDLLKKLLDNPRVESISIKYKRVGEVEISDIKAVLKNIDSTIQEKINKLP